MNHPSSLNRRELLRVGMLAAAVPIFGTISAHAADAPAKEDSGNTGPAIHNPDPWKGLKVGVASYTFKQKPVDPTIAGIKKVGLSYVSIKDFHLPLKSTAAERKEVTDKFRAAGITPLSCGVVSMPEKEETIKQAFEYARDAGFPTIVISPAPEALGLVEKYVKESNQRVAIHNHGPEDKSKWHSPKDVWDGIEKLDQRIGLCIDVGHTARAQMDPADAIRKYAARLYDVHFKDITDTTPKGKTVECGRGVLDIRSMLQALLDVKFTGAVSFEFEKDENDPLPGLAETVGYCKGVLSGLTPKG